MAHLSKGALVEALRDGSLRLAALDVFEQEPTTAERWAGIPNAVLTTAFSREDERSDT